MTDFSAILREYEELAGAREKLSADRAAVLSARGMPQHLPTACPMQRKTGGAFARLH